MNYVDAHVHVWTDDMETYPLAPDVDPARVVRKGRLEPGRMFLVDTREGRIIDDTELKENIASEKPYGKWLEENLVREKDLPDARSKHTYDEEKLGTLQKAFGYTYEDLRFLIKPSCEAGAQPLYEPHRPRSIP